MRLGKELSRGAYGVVYNAVDEKGKLYVIKRNVAMDCDGINSLKELHSLNKFKSHPHICTLTHISHGNPPGQGKFPPLDAEYPDGKDDQLHFVFERASRNLFQGIHERHPSTLSQLPNMIVQILLALDYVHSCGYIHLDVKPSNILVLLTAEGYTYQLCDFGCCRPYSARETQEYRNMTYPYRAPEICARKAFDYKVDLWAVGCTIYESLTSEWLVKDDGNVLEKLTRTYPCDVKTRERKSVCEAFSQLLRQKKTRYEIRSITREVGDLIQLLDLMSWMLMFDPRDRCAAQQALGHPYLKVYRDYIHSVRSKYTTTSVPVHISDYKQVNSLVKQCIQVLITCTEHRTLYHAVRMYCNYLQFKTQHFEYGDQPQIIKFLLCLYLNVKFFAYTEYNYSFVNFCIFMCEDYPQIKKFFEQKGILQLIGEVQNITLFELFVLKKVHKYVIYAPSEYEHSSKTLPQILNG